MKTPHAILIGLSLIAAAIFFKDTAVKPAHAFGGPDYIACVSKPLSYCLAFDGDIAPSFHINPGFGGANEPVNVVNWRTGKQIN